MHEIVSRIDDICWETIDVTYNWSSEIFGNAKEIANNLHDLFSGDMDLAMTAAHNLWCRLSHQHSYVSSAALPAYDFLVVGLEELNERLKVEILDIILGFAICTNSAAYKEAEREPLPWEVELKQRLISDTHKFNALALSNNDDISYFANEIISNIGS